MAVLNKTNTAQQWVKTDTSAGFATLRNVKSGRCLTGRSAVGFPVVTLQTCTAANTFQQWRLGTAGDLRLRANGLTAEQKELGFPDVRMALSFVGKRHQQWHIHPV